MIMKKILVYIFLLISLGCVNTHNQNKDSSSGKMGVVAGHGMVVSAHPASSRIGMDILRKGGNAIDAAIATEFALSVCYPEAGNIGGGGFMLIRTSEGKTEVIDYREKAPGGSTRNMFLDASGEVREGVSTETCLASGIPGTVDGMIRAHSLYGSLPFKDLIQPAIDMAENGFPITLKQAGQLNFNRKVFIERNSGKTAFVRDSLWKEGDLLVQKELAGTLRNIRDHGRDGFYSGKTADLILHTMKNGNGIITREDLSDYRSVSRKPVSAIYKGYNIITVPPPSGGGIILIQVLRMTEPFPVSEWGFPDYRTIHLVAEAERRAFADRSEYSGDPGFMKIKVNDLLNKEYLKTRMSSFDENKASSSMEIQPGNPAGYQSEETTHYSVVDEMGNAVSATTTLNGTYGNSIVVDGAGFLLNNEMDDFSVKPGVPNMYGLVGGEVNSISPGKKMLSSMSPVIVEKDGKLFLIVGTPGGSTIPTTVYQVITNVIDHEMNIQAAVDTPRFHHQWLPDIINYEHGRIGPETKERLQSMGHKLEERTSIGRVSAILVHKNGTIEGGADKRGDNSACGY
jgi:gamma-glutamyltranspeptidase/glutathione hydrolase